ncbi:MAG: hypothetical protein FJ091_16425 [Deltaproteobacteria bacterium]|nr:hypothetical protein [Deltaproteobacteria bacterium]
MSRAFRIAAGAMAAVFVACAAAQWNDPDALYWIALYAVAALLAARAAHGELPRIPIAAALAMYVFLALRMAPSLFAAREEAFTHWQMLDSSDELAREAGGVALCALWSAVQAWQAFRRRAPS